MKQIRAAVLGLLALAILPITAFAQTAPNWPFGFVPTPQQWAAVLAAKQDYLGTSGSGVLARVNGAAFVAPSLGVPASVDLTHATNVPVAQATGVLGAAHGGTSCAVASGSCLDNITGFAANGFVQRTGAGTYVQVLPSGSGQVCLTTSCGMVTPNMASPTWTGTATGSALSLSGTLTLAGGLNAGGLLGTSGQVLTTTGAGVQWSSVGAGTVTSVQVGGGSTGLTATGGPITGAGTITLGGTLQIGSGGTSCSVVSGACLDNITGFSSTGFVQRTGPGTYLFSGSTGTNSVVLSTSPTLTTPTVNQPSIKGVTDGSSGCAGCVGEFLQSSTPQASAISLTNNTAANITTSALTVTAGDWDIWSNACFSQNSAVTYVEAEISTTSAGRVTLPAGGGIGMLPTLSGAGTTCIAGMYTRISVTVSTPVYLVGFVLFPSGTVSGFGSIQARRVR